MTYIWTPAYSPSPDFVLNRGYFSGFEIAWFPGFSVLQIGQETILQDFVYTFGATAIFRWKDEWWNWNSNTYTYDWIVSDAFCRPPGGGSPINMGGVNLSIAYRDGGARHLLVSINGYTGYVEQAFPTSAGYWTPEPL